MSSVISMGLSIGELRGVLTLILMLAFIGMVIYVYSKRNRSVYDQAALLPLEDSNSSQLPAPNGDEVTKRSRS